MRVHCIFAVELLLDWTGVYVVQGTSLTHRKWLVEQCTTLLVYFKRSHLRFGHLTRQVLATTPMYYYVHTCKHAM